MAVKNIYMDLTASEYNSNKSFWNGYQRAVDSFNSDCLSRGRSSAVRSAEKASATCRRYVDDKNFYFAKKLKKLSSGKRKYYDGYASGLDDCIDEYYTTRCGL